MKLLIFLVGTFKFLCFATTTFMVAYWVYKYEKNENVTLVEYKPLNNNVDVIYPEITIAFIDPYFGNELINITKEHNFNQNYRDYLRGYEMNETFKNLDYEKLTPNLFDYLESVRIGWKPGSKYSHTSCVDVTRLHVSMA